MELKVFRDVLPAAGADCTAKAELPLETELLISDYLPPVQRIVRVYFSQSGRESLLSTELVRP